MFSSQTQWEQNDGKCGVCGDNWADPEPRDHEDYGKFDNGYIVQNYLAGQLIEVQVCYCANTLKIFFSQLTNK